MVNGLLLLLAFITCVGCADSKINLVQNEVSDIIIDPDQVGFDLDISDILVDSIEIIKLETNDNCLIGKIGKISFLFLTLMWLVNCTCLINLEILLNA